VHRGRRVGPADSFHGLSAHPVRSRIGPWPIAASREAADLIRQARRAKTMPRRAIVLVHGAWFTPETWEPVAARLRKAGFAVGVPRLHRGSLAVGR
jgi:alpha-beta hydrolase superfamily lysophospholipase